MMATARIQIAPIPSRKILMVSSFFKPMLMLMKEEGKDSWKQRLVSIVGILSWRGGLREGWMDGILLEDGDSSVEETKEISLW